MLYKAKNVLSTNLKKGTSKTKKLHDISLNNILVVPNYCRCLIIRYILREKKKYIIMHENGLCYKEEIYRISTFWNSPALQKERKYLFIELDRMLKDSPLTGPSFVHLYFHP